MDSKLKKTILVTGFGPFDKHVINASWEAVKKLAALWPESELCDISLVIEEVPVSYSHVFTRIPKLWKEIKPVVVLHTGVSHKAKCMTVESNAHSTGYVRPDIHNKCPDETDIAPKVLHTLIDVKKVCAIVNQNSEQSGCKACVSHDAGRYLCEYIYYQSLNIANYRTLFVHVPDLDTYSSTQTSKGLFDIVSFLVNNVQ